MSLPSIPNIPMENVVRVTPALSGFQILRVSGTKHLILRASGQKIASAILLGKVKEHTVGSDLANANVWLDVSKPKVILVFGRRGSGKSYDLGVLVEGLASHQGKIKVGNHTPPVIIFDPLNQFWTLHEYAHGEDIEDNRQIDLAHRWGLELCPIDNVNIYVPRGTLRRHPESIEFSIDVNAMDADDWCGFFKVDKYTEPIGQLLNSAFTKVVESGYRTAKGHVAPTANYTLSNLIDCIQNDEEINDPVEGFSTQTCRAVLSRLRELQRMPLFCGSGVNIRTLFVHGMVSVFMLREVDESTRSVVVGQIVKKILEARGAQWENEEVAKRLIVRAKILKNKPAEAAVIEEKARKLLEEAYKEGIPPGWVVLDEAHVLCPTEGVSASKRILIEYVKQGRAMGLSLAAATQQPSALSNKLISQRDMILVHHLGIKSDMDAALSQMNPNFPDAIIEGRNEITTNIPYMLLNSLKSGEAILSTDETNRNFIITIRPRVTPHGGKEPVSM